MRLCRLDGCSIEQESNFEFGSSNLKKVSFFIRMHKKTLLYKGKHIYIHKFFYLF